MAEITGGPSRSDSPANKEWKKKAQKGKRKQISSEERLLPDLINTTIHHQLPCHREKHNQRMAGSHVKILETFI